MPSVAIWPKVTILRYFLERQLGHKVDVTRNQTPLLLALADTDYTKNLIANEEARVTDNRVERLVPESGPTNLQ